MGSSLSFQAPGEESPFLIFYIFNIYHESGIWKKNSYFHFFKELF